MPQKINLVLDQLKELLPTVDFKEGDNFVWLSANNTITYIDDDDNESVWALIHESAHAKLNHSHYSTDHGLLKLESEAWAEAKAIASTLDIKIDPEHIEDCLDTYRDWLHKRATCPECDVVSFQQNDQSYICINCQANWIVPSSPLCKVIKKQNTKK